MSNEAMESHAEPVGSESMDDKLDSCLAAPPALSESSSASEIPAGAAPRCDFVTSGIGSGGGMGTCG